MKFILYLKSIFLFLIFVLLNFVMRNLSLDFIYTYNTSIDLDIIDKILLYVIGLFLALLFCICVWLLRIKTKYFNNFVNKVLSYKLQIFLWVTFLSLSIFTNLILFLHPIIYYNVFKYFFKNNSFINKYYLDFKTVKKYLLVFFILEFYFVIATLYMLFDPETDGSCAMLIMTYYMLGNFYFYLPFFILSWWDNRKLKAASNT